MNYKFLQALHVNGRDYKRGNHEVDEKTEYHPHFLRYVEAGKIVEADEPVNKSTKASVNNALAKRQQVLIERIKNRQNPNAPVKTDQTVGEETPSFDDVAEESDAVSEGKHGKSSKPHKHAKSGR